MGCGCRGKSSGRSRKSGTKSTSIRNKQQSTCRRLEGLGNSVNVKVGTSGRIFLASPLGTGSGLSVSSLLPSLGCGGSFARALKEAEVRTLAVFSSPTKVERFSALVPHSTVKLGYLRDVLRQI